MKKKNKLSSFIKGIIITFTLAIIVEGFVLCMPLLGIDVDNTISYVTETIAAAKGFFAQSTSNLSSDDHTLNNGLMEGTGSKQDSSSLDSPVNTGEEYTFDTTVYPYYALLSSEEQAVYNQIYANAIAYNTEIFTLVNELSESELSETINSVFNDHPELFWLNTSYKYGYNKSNAVVQVQLSFGISSDQLEAAKTQFNSVVDSISTAASAYSSDIEKELYIHDAICELATYDTNADLNQSAYSALVNGKTVCAGYSRAFQLICQETGLTCYYLTGTASGGDHAWNIISVDGDFYNVDLTWDDSISESYGSSVYTYFNLTDADISDDHTRSELGSRLPACTATAMSYTNVYGSTVEKSDIDNNGGQITEGNFTINEPQEPITDWRNEPAPFDAGQTPESEPNMAPNEMRPYGMGPSFENH